MKRITLLAVLLTFLILTGCKKGGSTGSSKKDPNGNWLVSLAGGVHCQAPAVSKIVVVSGGQFDANIVTWGTSQMKIQGTITMGNINFIVSGNEIITGTSCNGANGFFAYIDPNGSPVSGLVASNWGTLKFEKQ